MFQIINDNYGNGNVFNVAGLVMAAVGEMVWELKNFKR